MIMIFILELIFGIGFWNKWLYMYGLELKIEDSDKNGDYKNITFRFVIEFIFGLDLKINVYIYIY